MITPHYDLGIKQLVSDWRRMFSRRYLMDDLIAGASVACIAIPLSLAIALASGVSPGIGLISAIVAGIVCALFGGVPLAVSGPAAAMAVLVAACVEDYGFTGLLFVGFGCGILQLLTGVLGFGTIVRFVPAPVVMGFTAGIGAIILIGQFPRVLGLPAPEESHVFSVIQHISSLISHAQPNAIFLALITLLITFGMPRIWPRLPSPLFAVLIPSLIAFFFNLPVEKVGAIPSTLPSPGFPVFSSNIEWFDLTMTTLVVYALASLETLLSAGSVDQLAKTKPHDPNQELIGQGLGNFASALFGGLPITAVIARSAFNVQAGAKTRRSAIFHSLFLLIAVYYIASIISQIPIAVLAGLLMAIALRMCSPHEFLQLWKTSRGDATVYIVTFFMIVVLGLLSGIQVGIIAALLIAALRLNQVKIQLHTSEYGQAHLALNGSLTFLSAAKIDSYEKKLSAMDFPNGLVIDMSHLSALDSSGARHVITLVEKLSEKSKLVLYVVDSEQIQLLISAKPEIANLITDNDRRIEEMLGLDVQQDAKALGRVIYGIEKFKNNLNNKYKAIFSSLASNQDPHTLFITCCDSRIDPNLITSTRPGELFIVRNVGNIVPPFGADDTPAEGAAIEYALGVLNVKHVVICAHSGCGAIENLISGNIFKPENEKKLPSVAAWLSMLKTLKASFPPNVTSRQAAKMNAHLQMINLKTYPIVKSKLDDGSLKLQTLYYDIGNMEIEMWDDAAGCYVTIGEENSF